MVRIGLALWLALMVTLSVGCGTKEIDPVEQEFKADTAAAQQGIEEAMQKQGQHMRPEQKAHFEKMMEKMKSGAPMTKQ